MLVDNIWVLLFALPVVVLAGWIHGALGLGFPLVATSILAIAVDLRLVIFVTLLPTVVVNIASVATSENVLDTARRYSFLVVASLLGATVGAYVISITDPSPFRLLLAALIVLFLVNSFFKIKLTFRADFVAMIVFGLVAGFAGGATNVMVAVLIIYFLSINAPRSEMVPAMNLCFLIGKLSQIAVFFAAGLLSAELLLYTVPLAIAAYYALRVGQRAADKVPVEQYRRVLHGVLMLLAIVLVVQYFVT